MREIVVADGWMGSGTQGLPGERSVTQWEE